MKVIQKLVTAAACAALAVFLGAQTASAACLAGWGGFEGNNNATCRLIGSNSTACIYECICYGNCSAIYRQFGAKEI